MKYYCVINKLFANNLANVDVNKFDDILQAVNEWLLAQSKTPSREQDKNQNEENSYACLVLTARELEILEQSFNWNVWDNFPLLSISTADMQPSRISAETAIELSKFMRLSSRYDAIHPAILDPVVFKDNDIDEEDDVYGDDESETRGA